MLSQTQCVLKNILKWTAKPSKFSVSRKKTVLPCLMTALTSLADVCCSKTQADGHYVHSWKQVVDNWVDCLTKCIFYFYIKSFAKHPHWWLLVIEISVLQCIAAPLCLCWRLNPFSVFLSVCFWLICSTSLSVSHHFISTPIPTLNFLFIYNPDPWCCYLMFQEVKNELWPGS